MTKQQLSDRANKAWRTRRAQTTTAANRYSERAKKAWVTRTNQTNTHNNSAFANLGPAGKRVAIAQDVIKSLKANKISAVTGTWIGLDDVSGFCDLKAGTELQKYFNQPKVTCDVCALGACFVSAVKLGNNCKLTKDALDLGGFEFYDPKHDGSADDTGMWKILTRYFPYRQMVLIETAFEEGQGAYGAGNGGHGLRLLGAELHDRAVEFGNQYYCDTERRLGAIMQNIVDNKGSFKP